MRILLAAHAEARAHETAARDDVDCRDVVAGQRGCEIEFGEEVCESHLENVHDDEAAIDVAEDETICTASQTRLAAVHGRDNYVFLIDVNISQAVPLNQLEIMALRGAQPVLGTAPSQTALSRLASFLNRPLQMLEAQVNVE